MNSFWVAYGLFIFMTISSLKCYHVISLQNIISICFHFLLFEELGNSLGAENPFLLTFGILWFRWHNYWADKFHQETDWSDEKIYQEARKWVVGTYQVSSFT